MRVMQWLCGAMMLVATAASAQQGETMLIGTGERGDNYYSVGGAICRMMNAARPYRCTTTPTGGSIDNVYALDLGDVDFAVVQGDVQDVAYRGAPAFAGSPYRKLRSVATIYEEALPIGHLNAGSRWTFLATLSASGMRIRDLKAFVPMTVVEAASQLCSGRLDALALVTGHPSAVIWWLSETCSIRFITVDPAIGNVMTRRNRTYRNTAIPGGVYPFLRMPVATVGTSATVVTLNSTPDDDVRAVLGAIFTDVAAFRRQQFVLNPVRPKERDLTAPLHPAAARFYMRHNRRH